VLGHPGAFQVGPVVGERRGVLGGHAEAGRAAVSGRDQLDGLSGTHQHATVAIGDEAEDIGLARDDRGHFLVYNEAMQRVPADDQTEDAAVKLAEYREWPDRLDWDEGPDAVRYPGLYDPPDPSRETDDEDDLEPLDLDDEDAIQ
jgi:hypothetical protein